MSTSLLVVLIEETAEIMNLVALLDSALPKMAGLSVMVFALNMPQKDLTKRMCAFTSLINAKKVLKIYNCPI